MILSPKEDWQTAAINALTLKMIFAATLATLIATALSFIVGKMGIGEISPELLFAPWGIFLVIGISSAFHQGVLAERARQSGKNDTGKK